MNPRALSAHSFVALLACVAPSSAADSAGTVPAEADPTFAGEVVVREVDVRFDRSVLPPLESLGKRGREDFVYYEDGRPCPTIRFDPEGDAKDWRLVVWMDPLLAGGETLAVAARELAARAETLATAGVLEIVTATGATPRSAGEVRGAGAIAEALLSAAGSLARGPLPVTPETAAERIDRMVVTLAARPSEGPRAVLVLAAGWAVDETTLARIAGARHGDPAPRWAESLVGGARALAATGWVPIVLGLSGGSQPQQRPAGDETVSIGPGGDTRISYPVLRLPAAAKPPSDRLETALDFSLAPLADLGRPGSGALVGSGSQLAATLTRLLRRTRLVATAPDPGAGKTIRREVRWVGGDGRSLPTPALAAVGRSPELAAARLRLRLAGDDESGQLTSVRVDGREPLRVCLADDVDRAVIRFSRAGAAASGGEIAVGASVELRRDAGPACAEEDADPTAPPSDHRLVEEIERGEWALF